MGGSIDPESERRAERILFVKGDQLGKQLQFYRQIFRLFD